MSSTECESNQPLWTEHAISAWADVLIDLYRKRLKNEFLLSDQSHAESDPSASHEDS